MKDMKCTFKVKKKNANNDKLAIMEIVTNYTHSHQLFEDWTQHKQSKTVQK